jgi:hypothetical protein
MSELEREQKVFTNESKLFYETEDLKMEEFEISNKFEIYGEIKQLESFVVRKKGATIILRVLIQFSSINSLKEAIKDSNKLYLLPSEKIISVLRKETDNLEHTFAVFCKFGNIKEIFHQRFDYNEIFILYEDEESLEEAEKFKESLKTMDYGQKKGRKKEVSEDSSEKPKKRKKK